MTMQTYRASLPIEFAGAALGRQSGSQRRWHYEMAKRGVDILGAGIALMLLLPLLPVLAVLIKLDSPGPVFFSQTRVGQAGARFRCWKFRTMHRDAEARKAALLAQNEMRCGVLFKMRQDPRITTLGKWLRKSSVDELPQLFNVLRGDMSLVGPRPALPDEVAKYSSTERGRLQVKPGITCLWQISGRGDLPFDAQVSLDLEYANRASLVTDIKILLMTVPAVLSGRGAY